VGRETEASDLQAFLASSQHPCGVIMLVNSWKNYVVYCFYNQIIVPKDLCSSDCGQHADDFQ